MSFITTVTLVVTQTTIFGWSRNGFIWVVTQCPLFLTIRIKSAETLLICELLISFSQEHLLELFFAMFYASVNVGAVLCMWFVPMIRSEYLNLIVIFLNVVTDNPSLILKDR